MGCSASRASKPSVNQKLVQMPTDVAGDAMPPALPVPAAGGIASAAGRGLLGTFCRGCGKRNLPEAGAWLCVDQRQGLSTLAATRAATPTVRGMGHCATGRTAPQQTARFTWLMRHL